ncbi:MAG: MarR family winged helix-turn-helix transcriptional regulator [Paracoccaceae bacterium]
MFDFENLPLYWANRLSALARRELAMRFRAAGHDVSAEEWAILMLLWREDGQNPGEMSARTVRDPTTMTRLVDSMVRKGVVTRQADENDRRRSRICLTQMGRELQAILVPLAMPMINDAMRGISQADGEVAVRVLSRMTQNLSQNHNKRGKK